MLEEVKIKLKYARLDDQMANVEWNDLEIGHSAFKETVEFWRDNYDWRKYETFLNDNFQHFKTPIQVDGFESLDIHFLHHRSPREDAIPLLFVHGWFVSPFPYCAIQEFTELFVGPAPSLSQLKSSRY